MVEMFFKLRQRKLFFKIQAKKNQCACGTKRKEITFMKFFRCLFSFFIEKYFLKKYNFLKVFLNIVYANFHYIMYEYSQ